MSESRLAALWHNFLGESPTWYKQTIIGFLLLNPILLGVAGPVVSGWALIAEFIFTLALALRCYPLQPGGLLAIEGGRLTGKSAMKSIVLVRRTLTGHRGIAVTAACGSASWSTRQ